MELSRYLTTVLVSKETKDTVKSALPHLFPEDYAILRVMGEWDKVSRETPGLSKTIDPVFALGLRDSQGEYQWWRLERLINFGVAADMGMRSPFNQVRITEAGRVAYQYLVSEGVYEQPKSDTPPAETTES